VLRGLALLLAASTAGCGSAPAPVPQPLVAAEEQRLLRPFQDRRVVIADSVDLAVSANFIGARAAETDIHDGMGALAANRLALPGIDRALHEKRETRTAEGAIQTYVNAHGGIERPLMMMVGQTELRALRSLTIKVLPSGSAMTLDLVARGDVTVLAGSQRTDLPEVSIRDGVWRGQ